eukprot:s4537_g6.t1
MRRPDEVSGDQTARVISAAVQGALAASQSLGTGATSSRGLQSLAVEPVEVRPPPMLALTNAPHDEMLSVAPVPAVSTGHTEGTQAAAETMESADVGDIERQLAALRSVPPKAKGKAKSCAKKPAANVSMAPKKAVKDEEESYSYVSEEERARPAAAAAPPPRAAPVDPAAKAAPVESGPAAAKAKAGSVTAVVATSGAPAPKRRTDVSYRSKGKGRTAYSRRYQSCPHCWNDVAVTARGAALSQHMWFNEECIAWQLFSHGDTSWENAQWRAHEIKVQRDNESYADSNQAGEIIPARSASHRDRLEDLHKAEEMSAEAEEEEEARTTDPKEKKKKKKKSIIAISMPLSHPMNLSGSDAAVRRAATSQTVAATRLSAMVEAVQTWFGLRCRVLRWPSSQGRAMVEAVQTWFGLRCRVLRWPSSQGRSKKSLKQWTRKTEVCGWGAA